MLTIRKALTVLIIIFCLQTTNAQRGANYLSLGPSVGIPLNFDNSYKTGIGAGLRGYYGIGKQGFVLGNLNFISFPYKFKKENLTLTSVKFGLGTFLNNRNIFLYGDGGLVISGGHLSRSDPGLGVGLGFGIPVNNGGFIDIIPSFNAAFDDDFNRTWLDLHVAYRFRTGKR